jgi:peptidoglycan/LPS O-acetylase OafA/YrhL
MQLFLFALFLASIPAIIIFNSSTESWAVPTVIAILAVGAAAGIWLAERIRRKYGRCSAFFGKILGD